MAIRVVNSSGYSGKLKVVNNYGTQGSNYNPQPTYNPQKTAPAKVVQPATYNPQKTAPAKKIQNAPAPQVYRKTPQQLKVEADRAAYVRQQQWLAQETARIQREAEAARIREIQRKKMVYDAKRSNISTKQSGIKARLGQITGLSKFRDERSQREAAIRYYEENEKYWFPGIEALKTRYEREAARRRQELEKRLNAGDPNSEKLVNDFNNWSKAQFDEYDREYKDYMKTQADLYSFGSSKVGGNFAKVVRGANTAVQVPLGVAGKTFGALSWTAQQPSRVVNTAANFVNPNRLRQYYGGTEKNGGVAGAGISNTQQLKNAYNASKDQRILAFSKADEAKRLAKLKTKGVEGKIDRFLIRYADDVSDVVADPLSWFGGFGAKGAKSIKAPKQFSFLGKNKYTRDAVITMAARKQAFLVSDAGKNLTDFTKGVSSVAKSVRNAKPFQEYKTRGDKLQEVYQQANKAQSDIQAKYRVKLDSLNSKLPENKRADLSVLDELDKLNDFDVKVLSRMVDGKLSRLDSLRLAGRGSKAQRAFYENFAKRWSDFTEKVRLADDVTKTRFGKKKLYRPYTSWADDLDQYNFRRYQKGRGSMTAEDFKRGAQDRLFKSAYVGLEGFQAPSKADMVNELRKSYEAELEPIRSKVSEARKNSKGWFKNRSWKGAKNTALDVANAPMKRWKQAVLLGNPAWYVNNLGWNIPASISAGGWRTIPEMAKLAASKSYRQKNSQAYKIAGSKISNEIGRNPFTKLATGIENVPRVASYIANTKRGYTPENALKRTNDWLFSYSNNKFEQGLKQVYPFYNWNKGLIVLAAKMPWKYPRQAEAFTKFYETFYNRPYNALPKGESTYVDADGQTQTFNPREKYKGKLNIGNKWFNTPFNPMTPKGLSQINVNPALTQSAELANSVDRFGNITTDRKAWEVAMKAFPQYNLGRAWSKRNVEEFKRWFSESGYGKEGQGQDKSKSSYMGNLDNKTKWDKQLKSFFGIPGVIERDPAEEAEHDRYTRFNKDYFSVDWDKRLEALKAEDPENAYDRWNAEREVIAKKHGYDLKKDILSGKWTKYDTKVTTRTKELKEKGRKFVQDYWEQKKALGKPKQYRGSNGKLYWEKSKSDPFWLSKFDEWDKNNSFADNAYKELPYYLERKDAKGNITKDGSGTPTGNRDYILPKEIRTKMAAKGSGSVKYQKKLDYDYAKRTGDWSKFEKKYGKKGGIKYDGKFFKSTASRDRYIAGKIKYERKKAYERKDWAYFGRPENNYAPKTGVQVDGRWFKSKESAEKYKTMLFWRKYDSLPTKEEKIAFLNANPQMRKFATPTNQAEWDSLRAKIRAETRRKAGTLPGFELKRAELLKIIKARVALGIAEGSMPKSRIRYK